MTAARSCLSTAVVAATKLGCYIGYPASDDTAESNRTAGRPRVPVQMESEVLEET